LRALHTSERDRYSESTLIELNVAPLFQWFDLGWKSDDMYRKGEIRLTDIARLLGSDWPALAAELELNEDEVTKLMDEHGENAALHMLRYWLKSRASDATGRNTSRALSHVTNLLSFRQLFATSLTKDWQGEYCSQLCIQY
jgi:hypothetical protein